MKNGEIVDKVYAVGSEETERAIQAATEGDRRFKGGRGLNPLLIINWIAFILVGAYGIYLFLYLIKTRYDYIKLGKKIEFDLNLK
ncbi:MAG: hypothetical protein WD469_09810 [Paenibacillaceae bacterium]